MIGGNDAASKSEQRWTINSGPEVIEGNSKAADVGYTMGLRHVEITREQRCREANKKRGTQRTGLRSHGTNKSTYSLQFITIKIQD